MGHGIAVPRALRFTPHIGSVNTTRLIGTIQDASGGSHDVPIAYAIIPKYAVADSQLAGMGRRSMKGISIGILLGLGLRAAEPSAEHQIAMQEGLKNYLQAVNDCQETTARAVVTRDFSAVAPGMGSSSITDFVQGRRCAVLAK